MPVLLERLLVVLDFNIVVHDFNILSVCLSLYFLFDSRLMYSLVESAESSKIIQGPQPRYV